MLKIKEWFTKEIRDEYLDEMLSKIGKTENDTIEFLHGKKIDLKTLLIGTREDIFKVDGIKEYMELCRFFKKYSSRFSIINFLEYLNSFFPNIVKFEEKNSEFQYNLNGNVVTVSELESSPESMLYKMDAFYYFYFDKAEIIPCDNRKHHSFKEFQSVVKNAKKNIHSRTDSIQYNMINDNMRHKLLGSLGIKCCPYCNRQYITIWYDEKDAMHSTADLDHFYQKTIFPLFSLSLFNFVPSCQICNSRMKGSNETETLYPYEEGMDEFRFRCEPKCEDPDNLVDLWLANKIQEPNKLLERYELKLVDESDDDVDEKHIERIKGSIKVFRLEEVYKTHLEAAINEMLKIRIYLSGDYAKSAKQTLAEISKKEGGDPQKLILEFSDNEMRYIILGFLYDGQDKLDQPLGKMLSDILDYELKIKQTYDKST